jgi:hypothetical protein
MFIFLTKSFSIDLMKYSFTQSAALRVFSSSGQGSLWALVFTFSFREGRVGGWVGAVEIDADGKHVGPDLSAGRGSTFASVLNCNTQFVAAELGWRVIMFELLS